MSCEYHVYCITCDERTELSGNRAEGLMHKLIRHREAIAGLVALEEDDQGFDAVELGTPYGRIDPSWFALHRGHDLRVRDEYGLVVGTCAERYACKGCRTQHYCRRQRGHEGDHGEKDPPPPVMMDDDFEAAVAAGRGDR